MCGIRRKRRFYETSWTLHSKAGRTVGSTADTAAAGLAGRHRPEHWRPAVAAAPQPTQTARARDARALLNEFVCVLCLLRCSMAHQAEPDELRVAAQHSTVGSICTMQTKAMGPRPSPHPGLGAPLHDRTTEAQRCGAVMKTAADRLCFHADPGFMQPGTRVCYGALMQAIQ